MSFLFCTRELITRSLSASGEAPGFPANRRQVVGKGTEKDVIPYPGMVFQRLKDPLHYDRGLFHLHERELSAADLELIAVIERYKDLY